MKVSKKQCLFSLKVKVNHLPLKIVAAGREKAVFRFYLSLTRQMPDNENYDMRFDSNEVIVTSEMAKELLKSMLNEPLKKECALRCLRGTEMSTTRSSRMVGFRDTMSRKVASMRETNESDGNLRKTTQGSVTSRALLTSMPDENEFSDSPFPPEMEYDPADLDTATLFLTFRCYSNSPTILLTASTPKNQLVKKKYKSKNEDLFSQKAIEGLQKALEENREQRRKILSRASTSEAIKLRRFDKQAPAASGSKIELNKRIAKNFLSHRMKHFQKLAIEKPIDIQIHINKARDHKEKLREGKTAKIEIEYQKRLYLRSTREQRQLRERQVPFQIISLTMLKFFRCLEEIKDRFEILKKAKDLEEKQNNCARKFLHHWDYLVKARLPSSSNDLESQIRRKRRHLDTHSGMRMISMVLKDKIDTECREKTGIFLKMCFDNVKMKVCFYQFSLYGRAFVY
jgi:hypothetical protein